MTKGLLIDMNYCTGCYSCEVACQQEHGFKADEYGIKVYQHGPFHWGQDRWEYEYFAIPTDLCDLCADRVGKDKPPTCVQHCMTACMSFGDIDELAKKATDPKQLIISVE